MDIEKEIILITGANGLVAKELANFIGEKYEIRFLTRKKVSPDDFLWDIENNYIDIRALQNVKHIVHLAGAGIADKRWSKKRKEEIFTSRINSTKLLLETLKAEKIKIKSFISASAVGYYGNISSDKILNENSPRGNDFISYVCEKWEKTSDDFSDLDIFQKRIILRFGVIFSKKGGALQKMLAPIKLNAGAILGNGKQFIPWIHIKDLCAIINFAIEGNLKSGIYNAVAPEHVTNKEITKLIAFIYQKNLILPNIPSWLLKGLFGEATSLLLEGSRISAQKLIDSGYSFQFPKVEAALLDLK